MAPVSLIFLACLAGGATGLAPPRPAAVARRSFLGGGVAGMAGVATSVLGQNQLQGWAARADEVSDAKALLKAQFSVMEDVLVDEVDTQPGVPAWKRKDDSPGTYDKFEKGIQQVAEKVLPAMEQIGDGGDANQRKRIDAFKIHANSAVIASRRPEAASDRRKAAFELDEMEQALTAFLGRL